jgi:hypothetical protein
MTTLTWDWSRGRRVGLYNAVVELEARLGGSVLSGTGSPESSVTAEVDTLYVDTSGTVNVWLWVKASGSGNTGWQRVTPATGWDDLAVSLRSASPGSSTPTLDVFRDNGSGSPGVKAYSFSKTLAQWLHFDVQLPHRAYGPSGMVGATIHPHVHWSPGASTDTGKVRWQLEYTWADFDAAFPTTTLTTAVDQAASGQAYDHMIAELGSIATTGKHASSVLVCRVARLANATEDTFDAVAWGLSVDFHFQSYGWGGSTEYAGAT